MEEIIVSVIIVNWNGKKYLKECLTSLKNQTFSKIEVIIVDNASSDGSVEFVKSNFSDVKIIKNDKNYGFAKGNNIGIKASTGKYIATLNNDTIVEPTWIENLVEAAEQNKNFGMFASKILSYNNRNLIESTGMLIYPDGVARCKDYLKEDSPIYCKKEEVLFPSACAALYRRDIIFKAGLFDEDYFAYCEDTDLGLRIRMLGFGSLYVPDSKVYHFYSGTSQINLLFKVYLVERNRLWTLIKNFPLSMLLLSSIYTIQRYLFYIYGSTIQIEPAKGFCEKESRIKLVFMILKAYLATILNLVKLIKKRFYIMHNKKVKSSTIISWLRKFRIGVKELTLYTK